MNQTLLSVNKIRFIAFTRPRGRHCWRFHRATPRRTLVKYFFSSILLVTNTVSTRVPARYRAGTENQKYSKTRANIGAGSKVPV